MPVVINSRFTPLTYDEITRPLIEQTQAQEALENAYMETSDQASQIMAQANEQTDPIAYARLKNYSEALQQQAESLMRQGLNRNSHQSLINMRRRYNQDIVPVQNAVTRRNELMEERRKLRLTHPDMLQERDVISLDDLIRNPQMDLGSTLYGSDISKRAANLTSAIGKGRQSVALGQNLDKYTQTILSQSGLSTEEIQAALAGDDSVLDKALSNLYSSTGVDSWSNQAAKDAVRGYIQEGAMQGAGSVSTSTQMDRMAARRDQLNDRAEERRFQATMYGLTQDENGNWVYDSNHLGPKAKQPKLNSNVTLQGVTADDIVKVGPYNSDYRGNICKTKYGTYVIRTKDGFLPVDEEAAKRSNDGATLLATYPILFKGDNAVKGSAGEFNPKKAVEVPWNELTEAQQGYIHSKLSIMELKPEEVTIYMDKDMGRNDYKVVPKEYSAYGVPPEFKNIPEAEEILDGSGDKNN